MVYLSPEKAVKIINAKVLSKFEDLCQFNFQNNIHVNEFKVSFTIKTTRLYKIKNINNYIKEIQNLTAKIDNFFLLDSKFKKYIKRKPVQLTIELQFSFVHL